MENYEIDKFKLKEQQVQQQITHETTETEAEKALLAELAGGTVIQETGNVGVIKPVEDNFKGVPKDANNDFGTFDNSYAPERITEIMARRDALSDSRNLIEADLMGKLVPAEPEIVNGVKLKNPPIQVATFDANQTVGQYLTGVLDKATAGKSLNKDNLYSDVIKRTGNLKLDDQVNKAAIKTLDSAIFATDEVDRTEFFGLINKQPEEAIQELIAETETDNAVLQTKVKFNERVFGEIKEQQLAEANLNGYLFGEENSLISDLKDFGMSADKAQNITQVIADEVSKEYDLEKPLAPLTQAKEISENETAKAMSAMLQAVQTYLDPSFEFEEDTFNEADALEAISDSSVSAETKSTMSQLVDTVEEQGQYLDPVEIGDDPEENKANLEENDLDDVEIGGKVGSLAKQSIDLLGNGEISTIYSFMANDSSDIFTLSTYPETEKDENTLPQLSIINVNGEVVSY
jgi:hypothetical protein